ncbi:MAG: hypothetical protein U9Q33_00470 [Campylobacterota bacterium]|nr:hypothetical protein [Campylobacterota bacterium]
MNIRSVFLSLFIIYISLLFTGCGYKPASYYSKDAFGDTTYVDIEIELKNSQKAVLIKDTMNELVISRFNSTLVDKRSDANTIVYLKLENVSQKALQTDLQGYVNRYRTSVKINLRYKNKKDNISKNLTLSEYYDYTVDDDSFVTEHKKDESIKIATQNAISELFSKIAITTFQK